MTVERHQRDLDRLWELVSGSPGSCDPHAGRLYCRTCPVLLVQPIRGAARGEVVAQIALGHDVQTTAIEFDRAADFEGHSGQWRGCHLAHRSHRHGQRRGRLIFHMMAALAEFERGLIVERAQAGLVAAKSRGVRLGRPKKLTVKQIRHGRVLRDGGETGHAVAQTLGVSRATLYRVLAAV